MNRDSLHCSWECVCSPAGCSQACFNWLGSTGHVAKHSSTGTNCSPTALGGLVQPGLKCGVPFLLCCCYSVRSAVHPFHCSVDTAWAARILCALLFWSILQEGTVVSMADPKLPTRRCSNSSIVKYLSRDLSSCAWCASQLWYWWFLVVTWHKRKCWWKLLLSFSFTPIREQDPFLFNLCFKAKQLILFA